jgi:hypothetical protein
MWQVTTSNAKEALDALRGESWVVESSMFGRSLHIGVTLDDDTGQRWIRETLARNNVTATAVDRIAPSLEDVFLHVIEKEIAAEEPG